jgi:hypothetical protein
MMHRNGKNAVDCGEKFTFHRVAPHNSGFSQKQRKHLAEYIMAELLPTICIAGHNHCMDPA